LTFSKYCVGNKRGQKREGHNRGRFSRRKTITAGRKKKRLPSARKRSESSWEAGGSVGERGFNNIRQKSPVLRPFRGKSIPEILEEEVLPERGKKKTRKNLSLFSKGFLVAFGIADKGRPLQAREKRFKKGEVQGLYLGNSTYPSRGFISSGRQGGNRSPAAGSASKGHKKGALSSPIRERLRLYLPVRGMRNEGESESRLRKRRKEL